MRTRSGFSLIEIIVVIAIIALLAGLATPVFLRAKQSANEQICVANFKQFHTALELYRSDWGTAEVGTPAQMGFPLFADALLPTQECRGLDMNCKRPGSYKLHWPPPDPKHPFYSEEAQNGWGAYVTHYGPSAMLIDDASHNDHCPQSEFSRHRVLCLNLGGSVYWRKGLGDPRMATWFHDE